MKKYSTPPRAPEFEYHHQMQSKITRKTISFLGGILFFSRGCSQLIIKPRRMEVSLNFFFFLLRYRHHSRKICMLIVIIVSCSLFFLTGHERCWKKCFLAEILLWSKMILYILEDYLEINRIPNIQSDALRSRNAGSH